MKTTKKICTLSTSLFAIAILMGSCSNNEKKLDYALDSITANDLAKHIEVLASDEFEGRAPSTAGEEKTIYYLANEFEKLGLAPGNGDSYFQEVPLLGISSDTAMQLQISNKNGIKSWKNNDDFIANTAFANEEVSLESTDVVFAGYGIIAPEYNWNDYEGLDVKGKTVIVLVNDPGYATKDSTLFTGNAMTYYGRWTYKFEEAARQGASAIFVVHETGPAGYPWEVLRNSNSGFNFYLDSENIQQTHSKVEGWITHEIANEIFAMSGLNFDELAIASTERDFKAIDLSLKTSLTLKNEIKHSKSHNVIAVWPGSDRKDEYILYTAHWDHFGVNPNMEGDNIFNGADDNSTGITALIEIAEAFTKLPKHPKRSVAFMAVTCEEQGLLGSKYYAENPIYPANKTVGVINMDALNIDGKMNDITVIGYGYSELDNYALEAAKAQGRTVSTDPVPEKGSFFRSDHFSFAKVGIPAIYISKGTDHIEHGKQWTLDKRGKWLKENYHKPSDEYRPDLWDFTGMVEDVRLFTRVGYLLSMEDKFPNWNEGTEFKVKRDAMMKQ